MKRAMRRRKTWQRQAAAITAAMMAMSVGGIAYAMPQGEVIRSGKGEITRQDKDMTVNQDSKRLAIDWAGFDIANDERVTFRQPDRDSVALNRVVGDAASVIDGALSGNGHVYVINPNGVLFGKNASVDVGSLVASTARISDRDMTNFAGADGITMAIPEDSSAKVINAGTIRAEGGLVVLHAAEVENSGTIINPAGTTALAAARNLSLSADTAGKINFTVDGVLAKAKALNSGMLKADGGYLVMTARSAGDVMSTVVNNTGTMEAKTLRQNEKGEILLDGGDNGVVELSGTIDASGMEAGQSAGSIKAIGAETYVKDGAKLRATGAVDGGLIETSGDYLEIGDNVDIDAAGKTGEAGEWLLDPLDVVISSENPGNATEASGGPAYSLGNVTNASKTSWVDSDTINWLLSNGTSVRVESADINKAASISVNSTIEKTGKKEASFTLEAQRNITINKDITARDGKLNVTLNSDTDGDAIGAVIINADITTNGGNFTSGSGGTRHYNNNRYNNSLVGAGDPSKGTVGTYFGNGGATGNRSVTTNGGEVNLYGDVAIGLNGGKLAIDTTKADGKGGAVNITGTIESGNSYTLYYQGKAGWDDLVKKYAMEHGFETTDKSDMSKRIANSWEAAKWLAQNGTGGGSAVNDTYLATITSSLENSLAAPTGEIPLFVGGKGSGNSVNPADTEHSDGYYWVTGPEGEAPGGKGTKFADNSGTPLQNYYAKWHKGDSETSHSTTTEPNNSGPYVTVGYGVTSNWDDVATSAGTTKGFVQEKNLAHSSLEVQAGSGKVDLKGNAGLSVGLKDLTINTTGNVTVGGGRSAAGTTYTGQIRTDEGVSIHGADVTVGDRITSINNGVDIQASGNINVDGIKAREKINLTTTGENGAIVLNHTYNDGALNTESTETDAVIIDARGANGSFQNLTSADVPAIKTGTGGNWKVYSASPDRDTFGKNLDGDTFGNNLDSKTTARWHANSDGANGLDEYAATNDGNKYIFQVQPTVTVKADDQSKIYGDTADVTKYTTTATASFTGRDDIKYSVLDDRFKSAFQEGDLKTRYTGEIALSSEGAAKEKTRMDGIDRTSSDNARPYFVINAEGENLAGKEGYAVTTADGTLEILRRNANISGTGTQTYGNPDISWTTDKDHSNLVNGDDVDADKVSIRAGSDYTNSQKDRKTANAGTYNNSAAFGGILNQNGEDASINYNLTGTGTIKVTKADLTVTVGNAETVYGTPFVESAYDYAYSTETGKSLVNGDTKESLLKDLGTIGYDNEAALDGTDGKWTAAVGDDYTLAFTDATEAAFKGLNDYNVTVVDGKAKVTPYTITKDDIIAANPHFTTVYGDTTTPVEVKIKGVNGDEEISNTATTTAYIYDEDGNPIKTEHVGDTYDIESTLTNGNYQFEGGKTSKVFEDTASVTKAGLLVNVGNAETVYGTPFDTSKYDYAYSTETGKNLVNGDTKESLLKDLGTIGYDNEAALDGTDGKWTAAVGDDYTLAFTDATEAAFKGLNDYNVTVVDGKAKVTPYTITSKDIVDGNPHFSTVYGTTTTPVEVAIKGVNGDATVENTATTSAYEYNADGTPVKTKDVGDKKYDITSVLTNKNYRFEDGSNTKLFANTASVTPAGLTIQIGDASTVYGTKFDETKYGYNYVSGITNGDTEETLDAAFGGMNYTNNAALDGTDGKWTKEVGNYDLTGEGANSLTNYNVTYLKGTATVTPYTITEEEIVNPDGSPLYTTKYGQKDAFGKATFAGVNGDGTLLLDITDSSALTGAADGRITENVGDNIYDTTVSLESLKNKNYQFADGATSKTFDNTASVTPADLTIETKDVETEYGTVKTTTSEVKGLVNGDFPTGFLFDYGDYGGAYLDGNTKTNDVNTYHFGTDLSGADFLNNYTITGGEADVKIDPKDVTFFVSGTGNTLADVTYTVDPDIDAQLAYGEHVDADYTPGNDLGSNQYGVVAHINGTRIATGDVAGNYRYNYGGLITLSPTVPTKPDIDPHNPSNLDGSGSWTSNMGNHGVPGVERVAGLASAELPFFKVEAGQVSHYGTYDVAADPDKVRLEPTGKRLPEPNQPKTQYREYTKALTTTDGTGMFRMVYDGSVFRITSTDDAALALVRTGDVKNNVELSAEALHAGFSEMGILLEDLDGVYVHFENLH